MIRHVVLFRWLDGTPDEAVRAAADGLRELPRLVPAVQAFRFGPDEGLAEGNWDVAVTADFLDVDGYLEYRDHSAHRALIAERILPILAERAAVQFELER